MPEPLIDAPDPPSPSVFDTGSKDNMPPDDPFVMQKLPAPSRQATIDDYLTVTPEKIEKAQADLIGLTKDKIGLESAMDAEQRRHDENYATRQNRLIAAEGATMDDIKPWQADAESAKYSTSLWDKFGSPGFVISMIASAFTAMPMNSALNAGAAAMNAINEGDAEAYHRAFDTWKSNTNLALKRIDLEEQQFNQIDDLRKSDMALWKVRMEVILSRFNDSRKLALLREGMSSELLESIDAQTKAKEQLSDAAVRIQNNDIRMKLTQALAGDTKDPMQVARAASLAEMVMTAPKTPEQMAINAVVSEPGFPKLGSKEQTDKIIDAVRKVNEARYGGRSAATPLYAEVQKRNDSWDAEHPEATREERDAAHDQNMRDVITASKPVESRRVDVQQQDAETRLKTLQEKIRHDTVEEETKKEEADTKKAGGGLSGNVSDKIQRQIDAYDNNLQYIKEIKEAIKKYHYSVGAAGKVLRVGERLADVLAGSNETDRVQIMRDLEKLKLGASRLLLDADGRPLAVSEHRIDDIIGGGNYGDLTANTLRSLDELEKDYTKMRGQHNNRLPEKLRREPTVTVEAPTVNDSPASWEDIPTVKH